MRQLIEGQLTTAMLPQTTTVFNPVLIANYLYRTLAKCHLNRLIPVAVSDFRWEVAAWKS